jgi:hypothetical protein
MLFNELPISFPWYDKLEQQNRHRENAEPFCDFKLFSPRDSMLPFEVARSQGGIFPQLWEIFEVNSQVQAADISASIPQLIIRRIEGQEYYIFDGAQLVTAGGPLDLPPGYYYSRLYWSDNVYRYSEMFHVPHDGQFNIADDDDINFVKLTWWNDADIRPVSYRDKGDDGTARFKNVLYLDTIITASEPEIIEDGTRDGNDELIPTFQKAVIKYRITELVPDYLKKALAVMQMHDHVVITTKKGIRSGEVSKVEVDTASEAPGAFSTVDIIFQEIVMLKKGCGETMTADCVGAPAVLNSVQISGGNYNISGTVFAGAALRVYKMIALDSVPQAVNSTIYTSSELAAGILISTGSFTGYNYIAVGATTFGCDFGISNVVPKP